MPCASNRPLVSVIRPSAVPTRQPQLRTLPSAVICPVSGVMPRTSEILNSSAVTSIQDVAQLMRNHVVDRIDRGSDQNAWGRVFAGLIHLRFEGATSMNGG